MAKLSNASLTMPLDATAGTTMFVLLTSLGVLCGMIFAIIGVKLFWFNKRLKFNHSATNDSATGSSSSASSGHFRSSKDKRHSTQINQPVEVHGVFRQRHEDDFDIVPPKPLPPVRIRKLSLSTPSLFEPPQGPIEVQHSNINIEELQPPTRTAPKPPVQRNPSKTTSFAQTPSLAKFEEKFERLEIQGTEQPSKDNEDRFTLPQQWPTMLSGHQYREEHLKRKNRRNFGKGHSELEPILTQGKLQEGKATGYLRPSEHSMQLNTELLPEVPEVITVEHSVEQFGERHTSGYIKYEEIDTDGFKDFCAKWDNMRMNTDNTTSSDTPTERHHYEAYPALVHTSHTSDFQQMQQAAEQSTSSSVKVHDELQIWDGMHVTTSKVERISWETTEQLTTSPPQLHASKDFITHEEAPNNDLLRESTYMVKPNESRPLSWDAQQKRPRPCSLPLPDQNSDQPLNAVKKARHIIYFNSAVDTSDSDVDEKDTRKMRRPTGYQPRNSQWADLKNVPQDDDDKHLWLKIEHDLNEELADNIEEEFKKIRNSYQENEADFLETGERKQKMRKELDLSSPGPKGFGKSIDEDWENFEQLYEEQLNRSKQVVQFKFPDEAAADHDKESTLRTSRRPTGYLKNVSELYTELKFDAENDNEFSNEPQHNTKIFSILKECRSTDFMKPDAKDSEEVFLHEHTKDGIFEPAQLLPPTEPVRKPKPRQKVTFDLSTTEYYTVSDDASTPKSEAAQNSGDESYEIDEEYSTQFPKPTQRFTKMQYTTQSNTDSSTEESKILQPPLPVLFGDLLYPAEVEKDKDETWSTVHERRRMIEEMKQPYAKACKPPKLPNRNPIAQLSENEPMKVVPRPPTRKHAIKDNTENQTEA